MRSIRLIVAVAAMASLACSGDDGPSDPGEPGNSSLTVTVANNLFNPASLSVPVNGTVTWQWNSGGVAHNVTFQDGTVSGDRTSGSFPRTFSAAGTYPYVCTLHAAEGMTGTVTVTASTGGGGGDTGGDGGGGDYP
jgi:plastocyanin